MILSGNLYKILSADETTYVIRILPESIIYQAHFPEEAITPGACLVGIVKELAEESYGKRLQIKQIKNLKFLQPLYPSKYGQEVRVMLSFKTEDSVQAEIRTADVLICRMTLTLSSYSPILS